MKTYRIEERETLVRVYYIQGETKEDAQRIFESGNVNADDTDCLDCHVESFEEISDPDEIPAHLKP
jgi:hypothetical protein